MYRAESTASGRAIRTVRVVVVTASLSEFRSAVVSTGSRKTLARCSSVNPSPVAGSEANPPRMVSAMG